MDAHQNFRIFLVPLNFIRIEELIFMIAAQCANFTFFKARLIIHIYETIHKLRRQKRQTDRQKPRFLTIFTKQRRQK